MEKEQREGQVEQEMGRGSGKVFAWMDGQSEPGTQAESEAGNGEVEGGGVGDGNVGEGTAAGGSVDASGEGGACSLTLEGRPEGGLLPLTHPPVGEDKSRKKR